MKSQIVLACVALIFAQICFNVSFSQDTDKKVKPAGFKMHDGVGTAVIYSHRVYGKKVGDELSAWLEKDGPTTEKNLMKWDAMPKPPASK